MSTPYLFLSSDEVGFSRVLSSGLLTLMEIKAGKTGSHRRYLHSKKNKRAMIALYRSPELMWDSPKM